VSVIGFTSIGLHDRERDHTVQLLYEGCACDVSSFVSEGIKSLTVRNSVVSDCSPLELQFENLSEGFVYYLLVSQT
jgi:hypothetical protein